METTSSAVCVSGMHRSGTSMVARVLASCGLWLGPESRLMPARQDNPEGFFENLDMVKISDQLLDRFAGGWDTPPEWPMGWVQTEAAQQLVPQAREAIAALGASSHAFPGWGWKDPRTCLTLPFWQLLLPDMKVVVCLRNPAAVARSLRKRSHNSLIFGVRLWDAYSRQLMQALPAGEFLVTHYDAWFADPHAELERVLGFLGFSPSEQVKADAVSFVHAGQRHHEGDSMDVLASLANAQTIQLYERMCDLAGPTGRTAAQGLPPAAYRLGDIIDARLGGNAPRYLGEGWAAPQPAGTWSVGPRACIALRITKATGQPMRLVAGVRPLLGPGQEQVTVSLAMNGSVVGEFQLGDARRFELATVLPLVDSDLVTLEFRIQDPRAPRDLGLSSDVRRLGILLIDLRLLAASGSAVAAA
jgi:hypothetical protein